MMGPPLSNDDNTSSPGIKKSTPSADDARMRKSNKGVKLNQWNEHKMAQAVQMYHTTNKPTWIGEKKSIHQCTSIWDVPYSTLHLRIKGVITGMKHTSGGAGKP